MSATPTPPPSPPPPPSPTRPPPPPNGNKDEIPPPPPEEDYPYNKVTSTKKLYIFGDQTQPLQPHLKLLAQRRSDNTFLNEFLDKVYKIVQQNAHFTFLATYSQLYMFESDLPSTPQYGVFEDREWGKFDVDNRDQFYAYPDTDNGGRMRRNIPLETALTVTLQLGHFILFASEEPQNRLAVQPGKFRIPVERTKALGICTGSLSAAVACCAQSLEEVVSLGTYAVQVAFRVGVWVARTSIECKCIAEQPAHMLIPLRQPDFQALATAEREDEDLAWALDIRGPNAAKAFRRYEANLPRDRPSKVSEYSRPYIVASSPGGIRVQAPPGSIAVLKTRQHDIFEGLEMRDVPLYGLYHARKYYSTKDLCELVYKCVDVTVTGGGIISGNGRASSAHEFNEMIEGAVNQILIEPLEWEEVLGTVEKWCGGEELEEEVMWSGATLGWPVCPYIVEHLAQQPVLTLETWVGDEPRDLIIKTLKGRVDRVEREKARARAKAMTTETETGVKRLEIVAFGTMAGQAFKRSLHLECEVVEIPGEVL